FILELYAVENASSPPRALASDRTYTVYIPDGAEIEQVNASGPGGMPVNATPVPGEEKGQYHFNFPLRPGETRFQIAYRMGYGGEMTLRPRPAGNLEHFAVLMPNSMKFEPLAAGTYSAMPSQDGETLIQVATGVKPGQDISFKVTGTGMIADGEEGGENAKAAPRPGGGLGTPEGTPDPLHEYRWMILGALTTALVVGGVYTARRSGKTTAASISTASTRKKQRGDLPAEPPASGAAGHREVLLGALKEEMFQLELDRQQGRISPEQYAKSKAALDETLQRATSRSR
ncbi:MAG: hypothetical protein AB7O65_13575, partial [Candidatus Korobacteraceae bacterium]